MGISLKDFSTAFGFYLNTAFLPPARRAKLRLIERYRDKVSERLLKEVPVIEKEGKKAFENHLMHPNPFLRAIRKHTEETK